jgi:hypothetical protein
MEEKNIANLSLDSNVRLTACAIPTTIVSNGAGMKSAFRDQESRQSAKAMAGEAASDRTLAAFRLARRGRRLASTTMYNSPVDVRRREHRGL